MEARRSLACVLQECCHHLGRKPNQVCLLGWKTTWKERARCPSWACPPAGWAPGKPAWEWPHHPTRLGEITNHSFPKPRATHNGSRMLSKQACSVHSSAPNPLPASYLTQGKTRVLTMTYKAPLTPFWCQPITAATPASSLLLKSTRHLLLPLSGCSLPR